MWYNVHQGANKYSGWLRQDILLDCPKIVANILLARLKEYVEGLSGEEQALSALDFSGVNTLTFQDF